MSWSADIVLWLRGGLGDGNWCLERML